MLIHLTPVQIYVSIYEKEAHETHRDCVYNKRCEVHIYTNPIHRETISHRMKSHVALMHNGHAHGCANIPASTWIAEQEQKMGAGI